MKKNSNLRIKGLFISSWKIYKDNWFNFILIGLIFLLVSLIGTYSNGFEFNNITGDVVYNTSTIMKFISYIIYVYISIGFVRFLLKLVDGRKAKIRDIFHGVDSIEHFIFVILVAIITSFVIMFGTVLFVIPGIIAALGLMFSKYIIIENKGGNVEVIDAIKNSWYITKGYRWRLLWICIILILFNFIGLLLLIIGLIITVPVSILITVLLYRKLDNIYKSKLDLSKKEDINLKDKK